MTRGYILRPKAWYYFRTYENSQIRMVDLMKMKLDAKDIVTMSIKGDEVIKELRPKVGDGMKG